MKIEYNEKKQYTITELSQMDIHAIFSALAIVEKNMSTNEHLDYYTLNSRFAILDKEVYDTIVCLYRSYSEIH